MIILNRCDRTLQGMAKYSVINLQFLLAKTYQPGQRSFFQKEVFICLGTCRERDVTMNWTTLGVSRQQVIPVKEVAGSGPFICKPTVN